MCPLPSFFREGKMSHPSIQRGVNVRGKMSGGICPGENVHLPARAMLKRSRMNENPVVVQKDHLRRSFPKTARTNRQIAHQNFNHINIPTVKSYSKNAVLYSIRNQEIKCKCFNCPVPAPLYNELAHRTLSNYRSQRSAGAFKLNKEYHNHNKSFEITEPSPQKHYAIRTQFRDELTDIRRPHTRATGCRCRPEADFVEVRKTKITKKNLKLPRTLAPVTVRNRLKMADLYSGASVMRLARIVQLRRKIVPNANKHTKANAQFK